MRLIQSYDETLFATQHPSNTLGSARFSEAIRTWVGADGAREYADYIRVYFQMDAFTAGDATSDVTVRGQMAYTATHGTSPGSVGSDLRTSCLVQTIGTAAQNNDLVTDDATPGAGLFVADFWVVIDPSGLADGGGQIAPFFDYFYVKISNGGVAYGTEAPTRDIWINKAELFVRT